MHQRGCRDTSTRCAERRRHVLDRRQCTAHGRLVVRRIHHRRAAERQTVRQLVNLNRQGAGRAIHERRGDVEADRVADVGRCGERGGKGDCGGLGLDREHPSGKCGRVVERI